MKKILPFLIIFAILSSCKKDIVKAPNHLIERGKMVNIMYDLSILDAMKNQNPTSLEKYKINSKEYIFKKYKIDSVQFVQNNLYYSSDYKGYKLMYEEIKARLDKNVKSTETLIKIETKKIAAKKIAAKKIAEEKLKSKKATDSIKKSKEKQVKEADSIRKIKERK
ncbi:DUF4296 domain-containing protein, partial [Flavobacterium sp.]|uniref:DUF4296 domain-containing protein n=1 Tax=Flavobacterium sp. TaxID=239 RepID=UPI003794B00C